MRNPTATLVLKMVILLKYYEKDCMEFLFYNVPLYAKSMKVIETTYNKSRLHFGLVTANMQTHNNIVKIITFEDSFN